LFRSEVEHHCVSVQPGRGHHDVLRLEVAMHNALRVSGGKRIQALHHQVFGFEGLQRALVPDDAKPRLAFDELEDQVEHLFGAAGVEQPHQVRVAHTGIDRHLALEPALELTTHGTRQERRLHHLDRDLLLCGQLKPPIHRREMCAGQLLLEAKSAVEDGPDTRTGTHSAPPRPHCGQTTCCCRKKGEWVGCCLPRTVLDRTHVRGFRSVTCFDTVRAITGMFGCHRGVRGESNMAWPGRTALLTLSLVALVACGPPGNPGEPAYHQSKCDSGDAPDCTRLGKMYANGEGVTQNDEQAKPLFQRGCDKGDSEGCAMLGAFLE